MELERVLKEPPGTTVFNVIEPKNAKHNTNPHIANIIFDISGTLLRAAPNIFRKFRCLVINKKGRVSLVTRNDEKPGGNVDTNKSIVKATVMDNRNDPHDTSLNSSLPYVRAIRRRSILHTKRQIPSTTVEAISLQ
jgi:hypothetical protein